MKLLLIRQIKKADPGERQNRPEGGFTLIEILVALVIMAVIMVMIIYPFLSSTGYLAKARARAEAQQVARSVLDTMTREISQAMDIQLNPNDTSVCAVLLPKKDTTTGNYIYPLTPETDGSGVPQAIRFWQVQRDDKGSVAAFADGIQSHDNGNPTTKSWYTQFQLNPKNMSPTQTSSSFVARTIISNALAYTGDTPSVLRGISRLVPFPDDGITNPTQRQYDDSIIAITPDETNFDIPVLSFTPTPQVNETLQRDNSGAYVFKAKYPLWMADNWSVTVQVYNAIGTLESSSPYTPTTDPAGYVGSNGERNGTVNLALPKTNEPYSVGDVNPGEIALGNLGNNHPVIEGSETVRRAVDGQIFIRVDGTPVGQQYAINYTTGVLTFDSATVPDGTNVTVSYQYLDFSTFDPATDRIIVMASYSTRALLNIDIIASKRDTQSGLPQTIHLQQKVKLKNVVR